MSCKDQWSQKVVSQVFCHQWYHVIVTQWTISMLECATIKPDGKLQTCLPSHACSLRYKWGRLPFKKLQGTLAYALYMYYRDCIGCFPILPYLRNFPFHFQFQFNSNIYSRCLLMCVEKYIRLVQHCHRQTTGFFHISLFMSVRWEYPLGPH